MSDEAQDKMEKAELLGLYRQLFERGLGELFLMQVHRQQVLLGQLTMDKGRLTFKDLNLLRAVTEQLVAPCWDIGIVGAVCDPDNTEWESLSFVGVDHCSIPMDLSSTRINLLKGLTVAEGDNLLLFRGSVYRGFQAMLDAHLLPVVLPLPVKTDQGVNGLAVTDLRFASIPLELSLNIHERVSAAIQRHLTLSVEECIVDDVEFEKLFGQYTHQEDD